MPADAAAAAASYGMPGWQVLGRSQLLLLAVLLLLLYSMLQVTCNHSRDVLSQTAAYRSSFVLVTYSCQQQAWCM